MRTMPKPENEVRMDELKVGMDTDYGIVVGVYSDVVDFVHSVEDYNNLMNDVDVDEIDVEQYALEGFEDVPVVVFGVVG